MLSVWLSFHRQKKMVWDQSIDNSVNKQTLNDNHNINNLTVAAVLCSKSTAKEGMD